jgi:hypothetical protein
MVQVLPEGDPDLSDSPTTNDPRAVWKFPRVADKPADAAFWRPHEVMIFAPGDDPTDYRTPPSTTPCPCRGSGGMSPGRGRPPTAGRAGPTTPSAG